MPSIVYIHAHVFMLNHACTCTFIEGTGVNLYCSACMEFNIAHNIYNVLNE